VACVCVAQWYSVVLYELGSHCDSLGCSDPDRTRRSISRQQQRLQPRAWPASSESRSPYTLQRTIASGRSGEVYITPRGPYQGGHRPPMHTQPPTPHWPPGPGPPPR
jgi:hypothetical protein